MIYELLDKGKEKSKSTTELMKACGFSNSRDLTLQIAKERTEGRIICSTTQNGGGYYLPKNKEEAREFYISMVNRARNTFKVIRATREFIKQMDGQASLYDEEHKEGLLNEK